jgi:glycosyltransferase involved in cell wall biosynthesis
MNSKVVILGYSSSAHIIRWAQGVAAKGFATRVISCGGAEIDGIDAVILGQKSGVLEYFKNLNSARKTIRKIKPDILHVFQATGYALWGAGYDDCPKILTPLGSDILVFARKSITHRAFIRKQLAKYDNFAVASDYLKSALNKIYPPSLNRVDVIPFGAPLPTESKIHKQAETIRIVFMKSLLGIYGPHILLHAVALSKRKGTNITLDLFGDGPDEENLKRLSRRLGISEIVFFRGRLPLNQIASKYMEYDIMAMPSLSESFGVAALEASSVGLPVIASNVGGIPEVVKDGVTGILVRPGDPEALADAIIKLASSVELRNKMGQAGRKFVRDNFLWDNCLNQMVDLYKKLILERGET